MLQVVRKYFEGEKEVVIPPPLLPDPKMMEWLSQVRMSPDIWKLEQFEWLRIFVPCDMMTGGVNHKLIRDATDDVKPLHPTCYTHDNYTFWKKDLGPHSYGVPLPANYRPTGFVRWPVEGARIRGELWKIRPSQFILLDRLRQNGLMFTRRRVSITLPFRTVNDIYITYPNGNVVKRAMQEVSDHKYFTTTDAWMYHGIPEYWDPQIGGIFAGSQLELHEHNHQRLWMNKFYQFE